MLRSLVTMQIDMGRLYHAHGAELADLSLAMRPLARAMQSRGLGVAFGDFEGELLYLLIRDRRPSVVFEISPNAGWSTNYILAALTANGHGHAHSFELIPEFNGVPTDKAIRQNLVPSLDQRRLTVHVGDALKTTETVPDRPDFLMLDSCHDAWFAEWYTAKLIPRCAGTIFIQDIAFVDRLEMSTEASFVWDWLARERIGVTLAGALERQSNAEGWRENLPQRMWMRSNSIIFEWPAARGALPEFVASPEKCVKEAEEAIAKGDTAGAVLSLSKAEDLLVRSIDMSNRHRVFIAAGRLHARMGEPWDAARLFKSALSSALRGEAPQRSKGLSECLEQFLLLFRPALAAQAAALIVFEPAAWSRTVRMLLRFPMTAARHLARRVLR